MIAQKSSAELGAALAAYESAGERYSVFDPPSAHEPKEEAAAIRSPGAYRTVASAEMAIENHQWTSARKKIADAQEAIYWLGTERESTFVELLKKLERKVMEGTSADERAQEERLRGELNGVKEAADLKALATELESEASHSRQDGAPSVAGELPTQLSRMAAEWNILLRLV